MGKHTGLAIGFLLLPLAAGCATLEEGFYQEVRVDSNVSGAYCRVVQDGSGLVDAVVTPGSVLVRKDSDAVLRVTCARPGYGDAEVALEPSHPPSSNIRNTARGFFPGIATLGIAALVDVASSAKDSYPAKAFVWMERD